MKNNFLKGRKAEEKAACFLSSENYSIIARNWRCPSGEIDIVARDGEYLCFIEVKYRSSDSHGSPAEAVNEAKRDKLQDLARFYIASKNLKDIDVRFDVVSVQRDCISLIKNAFGL